MMATSIALCLILISCGVVPSLATVYTVGDSGGWALSVDYGNWASGKTFLPGDSLVFNYASGHTVDEVSSSDYSTCTVGNAIHSDNSGATTIPLQAAGTRYFICGIPGHCGNGMKLAITVKGGAASGTAPASSTTPVTPGTPAITTRTPPTETLPSSSSALSPFAGLIVAFAAIIVELVLV